MLLNKKLPIRFLLGKVKYELIILIIYATVIEVFNEYFRANGIFIPIGIPALLGTAISLILGFRINQSYDRWWEARKVWGAIVNDSRTLMRQSLTYIKSEHDPEGAKELQQQIKKNQQAWCYALARALKNEPQEELPRFLTPDLLKRTGQFDNIPNHLLKEHARLLEEARQKEWINDFNSMLIDQTHTRLCDAMGMAERIKNTVFPRTYSLVVQALLYLFVVLLPFGMIEHINILEAVLIVFICLPFFSLEKSALMLQDPFAGYPTDTPVLTIATTIENNLNTMFNEHCELRAMPPNHGYYII